MLGIEVVEGAVEICGHAADEIASMLMAVALAELDAGDFRDAIRLIGAFHWPGEQAVLANGHFGVLRIDAGAAEEEQLLHIETMRGGKDGILDLEVVEQEIDGLCVAGLDAANLGGGENHIIGALSREEGVGGMRITQIELGLAAGDDLPLRLRGVVTQQGATDEAVVTGDEKFAARRRHDCSFSGRLCRCPAELLCASSFAGEEVATPTRIELVSHP